MPSAPNSIPKPADAPKPDSMRAIKIFSYPKVIFIWPSMAISFICGIGMLFADDSPPRASEVNTTAALEEEGSDQPSEEGAESDSAATETPRESQAGRFATIPNILGFLFLIFFAVNMFVMSLDFPRFTLIAVILGIALVATLLLLGASNGIPILAPLRVIARNLYFTANASFYFAFGLILAVIFTIIYFTRYLDYWEVRPNEVLHHHGPFSDLERFPTLNMKFNKEIPDILEYLLGFNSGRLVLFLGDNSTPVVLEHVSNINAKEEALKALMGRLQVQVSTQSRM